jgi:methylated-DNA-[protein]-cysteine S-methyltransferase
VSLQGFELDSPIGRLRGVVGAGALVLLDLPIGRRSRIDTLPPDGPDARRVRDRLAGYFRGDLAALDDVAAEPQRGTPFQRRVWQALRGIRAGTTQSYGELAARIGAPRAVRAVGAANGANPVPLVLPCHRVIASDGTLGGYGGGLAMKAWLLRHEGAPVCNGASRAS